MQYVHSYPSPLGGILLAADDCGLTGLWFEGQKYFAYGLTTAHEEKALPVFADADRWLDAYFSGQAPEFMPPIHLIGTDFQLAVWALLQQIPYGQTMTYGAIAAKLAAQKGLPSMSAQAVGSAVGKNPVSILVPCHRVVGTSGSLTGYAGGIDRKIKLLTLEKADMHRLFTPKKGTAL